MDSDTQANLNADFLESIATGVWFKVKNTYKDVHAVKMIKVPDEKPYIRALWLSFDSPESMSCDEYMDSQWTMTSDGVVVNSAGVYNFGAFEADDKTSIYDEDGTLLDHKLKDIVLGLGYPDLITESEFDEVWHSLREGTDLPFKELNVTFGK